jgi:hypothetical protein
VQRDSDEDAWRAIVANYGDRVELDDEPSTGPSTGPSTEPPTELSTQSPAESPPEPPGDPSAQPSAQPVRDPGDDQRLERLFRPLPDPGERAADRSTQGEDADDAFVPPTPPPLPKLPPDRMLAWSGLFGSPTLLLVCLVLGVHLAPWLGYLMVAAFMGGFVYLVVHMPRGPADPWDDGARL